MQIVAAGAQDRAKWLPLWRAYLDFYRQPLPDEVTDATFARCLDPASDMQLRLAIADEQAIGFALCVFHLSSWARIGYCYLEDLFVSEAARGKGAGHALIEAVADAAKLRGCERLYWVTQEGNIRARALYDRVAEKNDFVTYVKAL
ncbi:MAG TPA: GNAT family N-acetyltransferase [Asticcacaulis sp.]|nr:GNAT family N-acetyltransferase [Asticcacaulis sp.]